VTEIAAQFHGPDMPASGVPARVGFRGEFLRVLRVLRDDGVAIDIPASALAVGVTGVNEDTLQLSWEEEGQTRVVAVVDPAAHRALVKHAPSSLAKPLAGGHFAENYHRRKWNVFVGILAGLVLIGVLVWWQSEAVTQ
jgi:hypothetical protein